MGGVRGGDREEGEKTDDSVFIYMVYFKTQRMHISSPGLNHGVIKMGARGGGAERGRG